MKNLVSDLLFTNYRLLKKRFNSNLENGKTGISDTERERILKPQFIENHTAQIFGKPFSYSSATAMLHSLDELFLEDLYLFKSDTETPYIIDCGANMGLSVLYFKRQYPKAKITAFEPDPGICKLLKKNVETYFHSEDITVYEKAVWTEETTLAFYSDGGLSGSTVLDFSNTNTTTKVETIDLKKFLTQNVDFLKIDIEGAENTVIFDIEPQLVNVKNLFLEYHGIKGEPQNLGEILNLLKRSGFKYYIRVAGETIRFPFCREEPKNFNQQLNIFCYRQQ